MVSVVIPTLNSKGLIRDQLSSLYQQTYEGEWEILVADNGCTDNTEEIVKEFSGRFPRLRWIDARLRRGTSAARNIGISAAKGNVILLCDHDDAVSPTWVEEMVAGAHRYDIVGSSYDKSKLNAPKLESYSTRLPLTADFVPGSSMGFQRHVWERLGGFNESLLDGGEDIDFCWRARREGFRIGKAPGAVYFPRARAGLLAAFHQALRAGRGSVQLYSLWGESVITHRSGAAVLGDFLWLLTRLPLLPFSRPHRFRWTYKTGFWCGLVAGMFRHRRILF